ncbi:MAG: nucleotidyl transferase AbiEii/AbiGii toxin family protein [Candidatus Moraniibacteriota bacterium]
MLSLQEIEKYYPENLKEFKRNLLREYLQYKILQIIFNSKYASKLSFLGGTALRIVHNNSRFSEDLDFDNFGLSEKEFGEISLLVKKQLELEGYDVEVRNVCKGAYRCHVKIPKLLFDSGLSGYEQEKILIQLDTAPHGFLQYKPDKIILNKFDVFTEINVTPLEIILAQKIFAIFNRKALKGRDFFDTVFLFSKTQPNYAYLGLKLDIKDGQQLRNKLLTLDKINYKEMASDVEPFLFSADDAKKIELFMDYIKSLKL